MPVARKAKIDPALVTDIHEFSRAVVQFSQATKIEYVKPDVERSALGTTVYERQAAKMGCTHADTLTFHYLDFVAVATCPVPPDHVSAEAVNKIRALNSIEFLDDADEFDDAEPDELAIATFTLFPEAFTFFCDHAKKNKSKKKGKARKDVVQSVLGVARVEPIRWHQDSDSRIGQLLLGEPGPATLGVPVLRINDDWMVVDTEQLLSALDTPFPVDGSSADLSRFFYRFEAQCLRYSLELKGFGSVSFHGASLRSIMHFHTTTGDAIHINFNTESI